MVRRWESPQVEVNGKPAALVEPYEDWEETVRKAQGAPVGDFWKPVYAELIPEGGKYLPALRRLIALLRPAGDLAVDHSFADAVFAIAEGELNGRPVDRFVRFFLYRPEALAYRPAADASGDIVRNVHVGVAMPREALGLAPPDLGALRAAMAPQPTAQAQELLRERGVLARALSDTVCTGIVDDVTGIANERFCRLDAGVRRTRVARYWQQGAFTAGGPVSFGREFDAADLDARLRAARKGSSVDEHAFYRALYARTGASPHVTDPRFQRPWSFAGTHGTHVADLAAGMPLAAAGDDRPILAVQVPSIANAETWGARLDFFLLAALIRILHWADSWPAADGTLRRARVVVNLSYGVFAGPMDGSGFLEAEISRLVEARNREGAATVAVLPSGNGFRERTGGDMRLAQATAQTVTLQVQPDDQSVSFLEIWLDGLQDAALTIAAPDGVSVTLDVPGPAPYVRDLRIDGTPTAVARAYVRRRPDGRVRIVLALAPTRNLDAPALAVPAGGWRLTLTNRGGTELLARFAVQRDDTAANYPPQGRQAYLDAAGVDLPDPETGVRDRPDPADRRVTRDGTLSSYATGSATHVYVVGSAFDRDALTRAALYSAAGPTPGRAAPDLSAVTTETRAHGGRLAAGTFSGSVARFDGTSAAAPLVTRCIVDDLIAQGGAHDKAALLARLRPPSAPAATDPRLGAFTLPLTEAPGRIARREFRG